MQIVNNTIVTSINELKAVLHHALLNGYTSQINMEPVGEDVYISEPSKIGITESVRKVQRFPMPDEDKNHLFEYGV